MYELLKSPYRACRTVPSWVVFDFFLEENVPRYAVGGLRLAIKDPCMSTKAGYLPICLAVLPYTTSTIATGGV